jgi:hypothetical protein
MLLLPVEMRHVHGYNASALHTIVYGLNCGLSDSGYLLGDERRMSKFIQAIMVLRCAGVERMPATAVVFLFVVVVVVDFLLSIRRRS